MPDSEALAELSTHLHDSIELTDEGHPVGPAGTKLVAIATDEDLVTTYIDRRSKWGSPFKIKEDGGKYGREASVDLYRGWFLGHVERDEWDPEELRGETLGCHCVPELCHGVVILNHLARTHDPQVGLGEFTDE